MLSVGKGPDRNGTSKGNRVPTGDDKLNVTESEFDENDDSAVLHGNIILDQPFNFRGFMNMLTGKQRALEIAHSLDVKNGVASALEELISPLGPYEQAENDEKGPSGVRRGNKSLRQHFPSYEGEGSAITPKKNPQTAKSNDMLVQSTPLVRSDSGSKNQAKDVGGQEAENQKRRVSSTSVASAQTQRDIVQEAKDLREEMSKLQEELANLETLQLQKDGKIGHLNRMLNEKDMQISDLKKQLEESNRAREADITKYSNQNAEKVQELEAALGLKEEKIKNLEQSAEAAALESEAEITKLNKEIERVTLEHKKYLVESNLRLEQKEGAFKELNERYLKEKQELVEKLSEFKDASNLLALKQEDSSRLQTSLNESQAEVQELSKKLIELEQNNQRQRTRLESTKDAEIKKLGEQITTLNKELKTLEEANKQLESKLSECNNVLERAISAEKRAQSDKSAITTHLNTLKIFDVPLGKIISQNYKSKVRESYSGLLKSQYNIVGFMLQSHEEALNNIKNENSSLHAALSGSKAAHAEKESTMLQEIGILNDALKDRASQIEKMQSTIDSLQENITKLIKDKEESVNNCAELTMQLAKVKEHQFQREHDNFLELCQKNQDLMNSNHELLEKSRDLETQLQSIAQSMQNLQSVITEKETTINEKQQTINDLQMTLTQVRKNLERIKGKPSDMISFESAQKIYHNLDRKTYNYLMVDQVNQLDLVELQNVVKNVIFLLETPFAKLSKKMPLVSIYLRYEKSLCFHLADKLHYHIYHEPIDLKKFTNDAYSQYLEKHDITKIKHPLELCLDKLYEEIRTRLKY